MRESLQSIGNIPLWCAAIHGVLSEHWTGANRHISTLAAELSASSCLKLYISREEGVFLNRLFQAQMPFTLIYQVSA